MRILCMLPAGRGVFPPAAEQRRLELMRSYATASTQIDADYMPDVSGFVPRGARGSRPDSPGSSSRAAELSVERAIQAEKEGYDAFCPFGTLDVGVREARQAVSIPVVGQTEASLLHCGMLDRRFAWVTYMPGTEPRNFGWAREEGVEHLMVASLAIGIPNSEYPDRREDLLREFVRCSQEAREEGAEMMGLGRCPSAQTSTPPVS